MFKTIIVDFMNYVNISRLDTAHFQEACSSFLSVCSMTEHARAWPMTQGKMRDVSMPYCTVCAGKIIML